MYFENNSRDIIIKSVQILNNSVQNIAGGIWIGNSDNFMLNNVTVNNSKATRIGGGVVLSNTNNTYI